MFRLLLLAAAAVGHPDLSGVWQPGPGSNAAALTIEQKDDSIRIREAGGSSIACGTMGKQCEFEEDGRKGQVSMWYNGPKLVMMEMRGKNRETVTKKLLALSPDGNSLTVEVVPISPPDGKREKLVFTRKP